MASREYRYCPLCGAGLAPRQHMGQIRPSCRNCDYIHFHDPKVAVIAFVTIERERLLLVRRGINPAKGQWALPGGYVDAHELPEQALHRELQEEVALRIEVRSLLAVFPMPGPDGISQGFVMAYDVAPAIPLQPVVVGDDAIEAAWFTRESVPEELAFESTRTIIDRWRARTQGATD